MYADVRINGTMTWAMVDTGVTHNFIAETKAKCLGLMLEKDSSKMKAINSEAIPVVGVAK